MKMGMLDRSPFLLAMKNKFNRGEAEKKAHELCFLWEDHYLKDPDWYPFKVIQVDGKDKVFYKKG